MALARVSRADKIATLRAVRRGGAPKGSGRSEQALRRQQWGGGLEGNHCRLRAAHQELVQGPTESHGERKLQLPKGRAARW